MNKRWICYSFKNKKFEFSFFFLDSLTIVIEKWKYEKIFHCQEENTYSNPRSTAILSFFISRKDTEIDFQFEKREESETRSSFQDIHLISYCREESE